MIVGTSKEKSGSNLQVPSRKWGDRIVAEENPSFPHPEVTPSLAQSGQEPKQQATHASKQVKKKTWANVVGNRNSANGLKLEFFPPTADGTMVFTDDDIEAGVSAWNTALIGQIMGEPPKLKAIVGFGHRAWSKI